MHCEPTTRPSTAIPLLRWCAHAALFGLACGLAAGLAALLT